MHLSDVSRAIVKHVETRFPDLGPYAEPFAVSLMALATPFDEEEHKGLQTDLAETPPELAEEVADGMALMIVDTWAAGRPVANLLGTPTDEQLAALGLPEDDEEAQIANLLRLFGLERVSPASSSSTSPASSSSTSPASSSSTSGE